MYFLFNHVLGECYLYLFVHFLFIINKNSMVNEVLRRYGDGVKKRMDIIFIHE